MFKSYVAKYGTTAILFLGFVAIPSAVFAKPISVFSCRAGEFNSNITLVKKTAKSAEIKLKNIDEKLGKSKIRRTEYWCYVANNKLNANGIYKSYVKRVVIIDGVPDIKSKFDFNSTPDQDGTYSYTLTIDVDNFSPLERIDASIDGVYDFTPHSSDPILNFVDYLKGNPLIYHKVIVGHGMKPGVAYSGHIQAAYVVKGDHRGQSVNLNVIAPGAK